MRQQPNGKWCSVGTRAGIFARYPGVFVTMLVRVPNPAMRRSAHLVCAPRVLKTTRLPRIVNATGSINVRVLRNCHTMLADAIDPGSSMEDREIVVSLYRCRSSSNPRRQYAEATPLSPRPTGCRPPPFKRCSRLLASNGFHRCPSAAASSSPGRVLSSSPSE